MLRFLFLLLAASWLVSAAHGQAIQRVDSGEEFVGPFPSWRNVTQAPYNAKGDGATDDTAAIQHALDDLRDPSKEGFCVLYFPAGTYRITHALVTHRGDNGGEYNGTSIIGEDPATTTLRFDGGSGNMLELDFWYGKVSRLTLDGHGKAAIGLFHTGSFSTFCEINDVVFRDMAVGLKLGTDKSAGQAEHVVRRCTFDHCSEAGVETDNWNSMDIWVWYSLFEDCGAGLLNRMGNFHAVGSVFLRSTRADVHSDNLCNFSFIRNTSIGSRCFIDGWLGEQLFLQGNAIYDTTNPVAIAPTGTYEVLALDNVIRSAPGHAGPVFQLYNNAAGIFAGNCYNVAQPVRPVDAKPGDEPAPGHYTPVCRAIDEKLDAAPAAPGVVRLPATPPNLHRKIFEVQAGPGDDSRAIQRAIDTAAMEPFGSHPVVHLAAGEYHLASKIYIPAGEDIQLIGDGAGQLGTRLAWTGPGAAQGNARASNLEFMLGLLGPSRATVSDLGLLGDVNLFHVTQADQPGGRIDADQVAASAVGGENKTPAIGIFVNGVENSDVDMVACQAGECVRGMVVRGGPLRTAGRPAPGQVVSINGGGGESMDGYFDVFNGGRLTVISAYDEVEGNIESVLHLGDSGRLTIVGTVLNANSTKDRPTYVLNSFHGRLSYLLNRTALANYQHQDGIAPWWQVAGDGNGLDALVALSSFWVKDKSVDAAYLWRDATAPAANAAFLLNMTQNRDKLGNVLSQKAGAEPSDDAIRAALADLRAVRIELPTPRAPGVTDVHLHRVNCQAAQGRTAVEFTP